MKRSLLVDANLLVVLAGGFHSPEMFRRHKALHTYFPEDHELLLQVISRASRVIVTPNTLTEASNLLRKIEEPNRSELSAILARLASSAHEERVPFVQVVEAPEYLRLGVTDSVLLELLSDETELLTADSDLHRAALERGLTSTNFTHLREAAGIL